jgi:hypothetical protein
MGVSTQNEMRTLMEMIGGGKAGPILQINIWINTKGQRVEGSKAEPGCSFDPLTL